MRAEASLARTWLLVKLTCDLARESAPERFIVSGGDERVGNADAYNRRCAAPPQTVVGVHRLGPGLPRVVGCGHMSDSILFEVADGLAHLTLNRPERLNAIDGEAAHRWRDLAREVADRDDIRAVLFDAVGPAFCAGGDVAAMATTEGSGGAGRGGIVASLAEVIHEGHHIFSETPKPIVAAVQGAVAGGGLGFMLVADYVVASEAAFFVSKYADIGLTPDCGVSTLLPQAVGTRRALQLLLTDRSLTAVEGLEWGLVAEVVPGDSLRPRARAIADHWLSGATAAYGQAKRLVRAGVARSYQDGLDDEARTIGAAFETQDARARVAAFVARSSSRGSADTSGAHA